ncbi:MAG: helix-turn-helix domain-containing protein [Mariprofundaceae bacterium]|nr:helix-turn-helix domain-containing protein [Mariprofundaceae bacterium]
MLFKPEDIPAYTYPREFMDMIDIVGEDLAYEYAYELGGVDVYIVGWHDDADKRNEDVNDMVDFFGEEKTKVIVMRLGRGVYSIPNCKGKRIKELHDMVLQMCKRGIRHKDIARRYKITARTVRNILHKARQHAMRKQAVML